jgi:hypothetical protein
VYDAGLVLPPCSFWYASSSGTLQQVSSLVVILLLCLANLCCAESKSCITDTTVLQHYGSVLYCAVSSVCSDISEKYTATILNVSESAEMGDEVMQWIGQIPSNLTR